MLIVYSLEEVLLFCFMPGIKAILFDIDGTLLDTREFIYQAFEHSFREFHFESPSREELAGVIGQPLEKCYTIFYPKSDVPALAEAHRVFQMENLHLVVPFPNTLKTLESLRKAGFVMAAVTTRSNRTGLSSLQQAHIAEFFPVIVAGDDVKKHKPDPEPVFLALERLGIPPKDAVMVGDTSFDVQAGKRAGVSTVGVTYGFLGPQIIEEKPDFLANDISDLVSILGF